MRKVLIQRPAKLVAGSVKFEEIKGFLQLQVLALGAMGVGQLFLIPVKHVGEGGI
jgi:hypothetical protein